MPTPPDSLPDDASALKALLVAAQAENERLIAIIKASALSLRPAVGKDRSRSTRPHVGGCRTGHRCERGASGKPNRGPISQSPYSAQAPGQSWGVAETLAARGRR